MARCSRCAQLLPAGTAVCGACLRHPPLLKHCVAAVDYAYPWRSLLTDFKFRGDTGLARCLAGLLLATPEARQLLAECDGLIPMPLSSQRLKERGFQQSLLLARPLARATGARLLSQAVLRLHTGQAQHDLPRAQRLRQLRGVFSVHHARASQIAGRKLLLLDDIMTTGASLHALADCLLRAGASQVSAMVVARTP
ncbi:ComF family protein [Comamonas composti]|uniref:ComF family protein n=1 Tax=Comamonas composti TaxID=408558 RepID=UPI0004292833|nr:phosphoribosyltransferase family protein [Comamonas composti]